MARLLTRPAPARQDTLYPERRPSHSLYLPLGKRPRLPFTARIERAPFHRARSESKEGPGRSLSFFNILLGLAGGGQGLVDFPDEAPFNFRDFLRAHAEDASTLGQFFEVGLDAEPGDIRRERMKRQHVLIP